MKAASTSQQTKGQASASSSTVMDKKSVLSSQVGQKTAESQGKTTSQQGSNQNLARQGTVEGKSQVQKQPDRPQISLLKPEEKWAMEYLSEQMQSEFWHLNVVHFLTVHSPLAVNPTENSKAIKQAYQMFSKILDESLATLAQDKNISMELLARMIRQCKSNKEPKKLAQWLRFADDFSLFTKGLLYQDKRVKLEAQTLIEKSASNPNQKITEQQIQAMRMKMIAQKEEEKVQFMILRSQELSLSEQEQEEEQLRRAIELSLLEQELAKQRQLEMEYNAKSLANEETDANLQKSDDPNTEESETKFKPDVEGLQVEGDDQASSSQQQKKQEIDEIAAKEQEHRVCGIALATYTNETNTQDSDRPSESLHSLPQISKTKLGSIGKLQDGLSKGRDGSSTQNTSNETPQERKARLMAQRDLIKKSQLEAAEAEKQRLAEVKYEYSSRPRNLKMYIVSRARQDAHQSQQNEQLEDLEEMFTYKPLNENEQEKARRLALYAKLQLK